MSHLNFSLSELEELANKVEAILFVAQEPVKPLLLKKLLSIEDENTLESIIHLLIERYSNRGIKIEFVAGGWQFTTAPKYKQLILKFISEKPFKLPSPTLEVLAIIAYKQPITKAEIEEIRGIDSGGAIKTLLSLGLIQIIGRKEEPGRPFLYGTTEKFLETFRISSLKDLPKLREIKELIKEEV